MDDSDQKKEGWNGGSVEEKTLGQIREQFCPTLSVRSLWSGLC